MNSYSGKRLVFHLLLAMILTLLHVGPTFASLDPDADTGLMDKIIAIDVQEIGPGTSLSIQGNGIMPAIATRTETTPPHIIIDLLTAIPSFKTIRKQISGPNVKSLIVGHHPEIVRLVLIVNGPDIPKFSTALEGIKLIVRLNTNNLDDKGDMVAETDMPAVDEKKEAITVPRQIDTALAQPTMDDHPESIESKPSDTEESVKPESINSEIFYADKKLIQLEVIDERSDIGKYLKAVNAYRAQDWSGTIDHLHGFISTSPMNLYAEKAYFLLAKAYDRLYTDSLFTHFNELKGFYEDAIYRYPESRYTPDAYLSIGNLFFRSETYSEALGYYNMVIEMDKIAGATIRAQLQKAKILSVKDKKKAALAIYKSVCRQYPGLAETVQAKVEMAIILFEINQFHNAINILTPLVEQPEYIYAYPEILSYLGNNYYQLGSFAKARQPLFRFYNSFPDKEQSPLILARIADAYREEGLQREAIKFYNLVLERYPQTEGALISMYRLAALQENGDLSSGRGLLPKLNIFDDEIEVPRKIYEDVIQNAIENDESTPLLQFALLKLSIIDQGEEQYEKSLERLKTLQRKYPRSKLKQEIEHTFEKTLLSILQAHLRVKKFKQVFNTYQAEKSMIEKLNSPEIFITIARAALELNLVGTGVEMFSKAALHLPDEKKPADLLFYVGREYFNSGEFARTLRHMDLLLTNHPGDKFTSDAWMLKGKVFFLDSDYRKASRMFSNALKHCVKPCQQARILIHHAKALIHMELNKDTFQVLRDAEKRIKSCYEGQFHQYQEIGNLYIQLGKPEKALAILKLAHDLESEEESKTRLKILMAHCYELLNKKKSYLAIYSEIAKQNDPFWRNIAREKMEAINFKPIILQKK